MAKRLTHALMLSEEVNCKGAFACLAPPPVHLQDPGVLFPAGICLLLAGKSQLDSFALLALPGKDAPAFGGQRTRSKRVFNRPRPAGSAH